MTTKVYEHPKNFISNLPKNHRGVIMRAAKETGVRIYTEDSAYKAYGQRIKDAISVFTSVQDQNLTPMWIRYNELISYNTRSN